MARSTTTLIAGLTVGGLLVAVGSMRSQQLNDRLDALLLECQQENERIQQRSDPAGIRFELDCSRYLSDPSAPGVQGKIAEAYAAYSWWDSAILVGVLLALLLAVPWSWYFLLRRLGELRQALIGR